MNLVSEKSGKYYFILLFILSFLFRLILIIIYRFDGFYGQDSYAYYEYSKIFIESVSRFQIPPNFYWPIGFYLFTSIFTLITGSNIGLAALLVSLNVGSLCAGVAYLISYELLQGIYSEVERKKISLYTGLIVCFSPILVKSSIVIMSDALGLLFAMCGVFYFVKYTNHQKLSYIIVSFAFISLSIMTRYAYLIIIFPLIIYFLYLLINKSKGTEFKLKHLLISAFIGLLIFSPQLYYILNYGIPNFQYEGEIGTWASSWNPVNLFKKDFTALDGTIHYKLWNGLYYLSPVFHPIYLSIFGITFLVGAYKLLKNQDLKIIILTFCWFLTFYLCYAGFPFQSLRFTMSFHPALVIVSAIGLLRIDVKKVYKKLFLIVGIMCLISYNVYHISDFAKQKQDDLGIVSWVDKNIPSGAMMFAFEITGTLKHYSRIKPEEFFNFTQEELMDKISSFEGEIFFILPVGKLHTQWKDLPLEKNYEFIKSNYQLREITQLSYYTIFKLHKLS